MTKLYFNGKIYVEQGRFADSMLICEDKIAAVGRFDDITARISDYIDTETQSVCAIEKIDLMGRCVLPGINDSHQHTLGVGKLLASVNLAGVRSVDEMVERAKLFMTQHPLKDGDVLVGRGWNQDYFADNRMPTRHDMDRITTEYPVIFTRACGHILVANTKALETAGIDKNTKAAEGGEIYRDAEGVPNGLVSENALPQIYSILPPLTPQMVADRLSLAMAKAAEYGITTLQTNDIDTEEWQIIHEGIKLLYKTNPKAVRSCQQVTFTNPEDYEKFIAMGTKTGSGDDMLRYGPLKMYSDGSLGARTAYLRQPYADDASTQGIPTLTPQQLDGMIKTAEEHGCQVIVHCIGDGAMEMVLNAYDKVTEKGNPLRHGIVHCQITDRQLIQRFADRDILAFVQPIFIHYDMTVVEKRVGKTLADTSYAFGDMYRMGIHTSYGTDSPVEDMNPWENIYTAVTRRRLDGKGEYLPQQAVSVEDAVDQYTAGSAYAEFCEDKKGRLKAGCLADFIVLDRDIFTIPAEEIKDIKVLSTVLGGREIYSA